MDARNRKWLFIAVLSVATCLVVSACQAAEKTPEREIVYEKQLDCPYATFSETPSIQVEDTELGMVDRAWTHKFRMTCEEPYIKGWVIGLIDGYFESS